jgi:hypothetical protein
VAQVRVPRKGVTVTELAAVLGRRLGTRFEVAADGNGEVLVRRSPLTGAVVRISHVPGATVFRVRGTGVPVASFGTTRMVVDALRRSPEFRSI